MGKKLERLMWNITRACTRIEKERENEKKITTKPLGIKLYALHGEVALAVVN
jgi:hypothetical protein